MYRLDGPEDAEVPALENGKCWYAGKAEQTDCAPSVNMPPWPCQAGRWCNSRTGYRRLPEPVLPRELVLTAHLTRAGVEDLINDVANQPGIGGYRKIAAALLAGHDIEVSHLTVQRVLTPNFPGIHHLLPLNVHHGSLIAAPRCFGTASFLPD